jgi:LysR family transcriptional regulator, low CO2-responsive transcriptional regulator
VFAITLRTVAITLTQLSAFLAVIRGGSVTAAADELVVTQPSVSSAIAALGRELGCELFERSGRGVKPSPAGLAFTPYAEDVIGLLHRGRRAAHEAAATARRRLQIVAVTTAAESFVPPLMRSFATRHPEVTLTLDVGNRHYVIERILRHEADVAITGAPPAADGRLVAEPLAGNDIVCITSREDSLCGHEHVPTSALADRTWLLREPGSGTRALNEQFLAAHNLHPPTLTLGSNGAIRQAARAGLGISLLSRAAVEIELSSELLGELELEGLPRARPWFVLRSAAGPVTDCVGLFMEFLAAAPEAQDMAGAALS